MKIRGKISATTYCSLIRPSSGSQEGLFQYITSHRPSAVINSAEMGWRDHLGGESILPDHFSVWGPPWKSFLVFASVLTVLTTWVEGDPPSMTVLVNISWRDHLSGHSWPIVDISIWRSEDPWRPNLEYSSWRYSWLGHLTGWLVLTLLARVPTGWSLPNQLLTVRSDHHDHISLII